MEEENENEALTPSKVTIKPIVANSYYHSAQDIENEAKDEQSVITFLISA